MNYIWVCGDLAICHFHELKELGSCVLRCENPLDCHPVNVQCGGDLLYVLKSKEYYLFLIIHKILLPIYLKYCDFTRHFVFIMLPKI